MQCEMTLTHAQIWLAIDRLAERHGMTPSGLARHAGLDPTAFNPSKRTRGDRLHWPSTESIAKILAVTETGVVEFFEPSLAPIRAPRDRSCSRA